MHIQLTSRLIIQHLDYHRTYYTETKQKENVTQFYTETKQKGNVAQKKRNPGFEPRMPGSEEQQST